MPVTKFLFILISVLFSSSFCEGHEKYDNVMTEKSNLRTDFKFVIPLPNKPVKSLDMQSYLGLWYQVYTNDAVTFTFEKDLYCVTAKYGAIDDKKISVYNYGTKGGPTGPVMDIRGYAYTPDKSEPGKLRVHFEKVPFDGYYWILKLGPVVDGKYDWAIVSDNLSLTMFVLARDVDNFKMNYDKIVLAELLKLHFYHPISTYQGKDCKYDSSELSEVRI